MAYLAGLVHSPAVEKMRAYWTVPNWENQEHVILSKTPVKHSPLMMSLPLFDITEDVQEALVMTDVQRPISKPLMATSTQEEFAFALAEMTVIPKFKLSNITIPKFQN